MCVSVLSACGCEGTAALHLSEGGGSYGANETFGSLMDWMAGQAAATVREGGRLCVHVWGVCRLWLTHGLDGGPGIGHGEGEREAMAGG